MDPRWLPWCWAAGAAGCALLLLVVQPWRREWAAGFHLVRKYPGAWALPALLLLVDAGVETLFRQGRGPAVDPAPSLLSGVAQAVTESLHGLHFGAGAALSGALLVAVNAWGMRRGLMKGWASVTGRAGYGVWLILGLGAAALGADLALKGYGVPAVWHAVAAALAIPLVGWMAAMVLAGLLLLAETEGRAPEKVAEVRWLESAAAHSVRLWPWVLAHGLAWWLGRGLPPWAANYAREVLALFAVGLAFAPLVFLHVKQTMEAAQGSRRAMECWRTKGWQPFAWLAVAGVVFYLGELAAQGVVRAVSGQPPLLRIGLASLLGLVHTGVSVMGLGAWVGFRLAAVPSPERPRRPRR